MTSSGEIYRSCSYFNTFNPQIRALRENVVEAIRGKIINQESFEIYLVRANYGILAVKYMGGKVPPETIANMEKVLQNMKLPDAENYEQVFQYDNELHSELVKMTKLEYFYKLWKYYNRL